MSPLKATALWLLYSLGALALAHPDSNDNKLKTLTLPDNNPGSKILNRRASDEDLCTDGGCAACFGSGFQDCPNSSIYCYKPGDSAYGIESCSSDASSSSSGSSSGSDSGSTDTTTTSTDFSVPTTDTCENGGLSCAYCFGEGNVACPQSDGYCYDPSNSTSICPEDIGSGSGSTSSETGSAAASGSSSPTTDSESSTTPASGADSTDASGGVAGGSGGADTQSSGTSTSSSSATSGSNSGQGSAGNGNGNSNGSPIQNSNGYSVVREGLVGVLAAGSVAFVAAMHLRI